MHIFIIKKKRGFLVIRRYLKAKKRASSFWKSFTGKSDPTSPWNLAGNYWLIYINKLTFWNSILPISFHWEIILNSIIINMNISGRCSKIFQKKNDYQSLKGFLLDIFLRNFTVELPFMLVKACITAERMSSHWTCHEIFSLVGLVRRASNRLIPNH